MVPETPAASVMRYPPLAAMLLCMIAAREVSQGERFYYASPHTIALAVVMRGATGMSLSTYLTPHLWQAIGAEHSAFWYTDRTGLEVAFGNFNATLRDYARLGVVLANDGVRPDDPDRREIIPHDFLLDAIRLEARARGLSTQASDDVSRIWLSVLDIS